MLSLFVAFVISVNGCQYFDSLYNDDNFARAIGECYKGVSNDGTGSAMYECSADGTSITMNVCSMSSIHQLNYSITLFPYCLVLYRLI